MSRLPHASFLLITGSSRSTYQEIRIPYSGVLGSVRLASLHTIHRLQGTDTGPLCAQHQVPPCVLRSCHHCRCTTRARCVVPKQQPWMQLPREQCIMEADYACCNHSSDHCPELLAAACV